MTESTTKFWQKHVKNLKNFKEQLEKKLKITKKKNKSEAWNSKKKKEKQQWTWDSQNKPTKKQRYKLFRPSKQQPFLWFAVARTDLRWLAL